MGLSRLVPLSLAVLFFFHAVASLPLIAVTSSDSSIVHAHSVTRPGTHYLNLTTAHWGNRMAGLPANTSKAKCDAKCKTQADCGDPTECVCFSGYCWA